MAPRKIGRHPTSIAQQSSLNSTPLPGEVSVCRFIGSLDDLGRFFWNAETERVLGRLNLREKDEKPPFCFWAWWAGKGSRDTEKYYAWLGRGMRIYTPRKAVLKVYTAQGKNRIHVHLNEAVLKVYAVQGKNGIHVHLNKAVLKVYAVQGKTRTCVHLNKVVLHVYAGQGVIKMCTPAKTVWSAGMSDTGMIRVRAARHEGINAIASMAHKQDVMECQTPHILLPDNDSDGRVPLVKIPCCRNLPHDMPTHMDPWPWNQTLPSSNMFRLLETGRAIKIMGFSAVPNSIWLHSSRN